MSPNKGSSKQELNSADLRFQWREEVAEAPAFSSQKVASQEAPTWSSSESVFSAAMTKLNFLEKTLTLPNRNLGFSEFCREILIALAEAIPSAAGAIFELDADREFLFFRATLGESADQVLSIEVPSDRGVFGHVLETREAILITTAQSNELHLKSVGHAVGYEAKNLMAAPIMIRGRVFGVVELLDRMGEPTYLQEDLELFRDLAGFSASLIETRLTLSFALQALAAENRSTEERAA